MSTYSQLLQDWVVVSPQIFLSQESSGTGNNKAEEINDYSCNNENCPSECSSTSSVEAIDEEDPIISCHCWQENDMTSSCTTSQLPILPTNMLTTQTTDHRSQICSNEIDSLRSLAVIDETKPLGLSTPVICQQENELEKLQIVNLELVKELENVKAQKAKLDIFESMACKNEVAHLKENKLELEEKLLLASQESELEKLQIVNLELVKELENVKAQKAKLDLFGSMACKNKVAHLKENKLKLEEKLLLASQESDMTPSCTTPNLPILPTNMLTTQTTDPRSQISSNESGSSSSIAVIDEEQSLGLSSPLPCQQENELHESASNNPVSDLTSIDLRNFTGLCSSTFFNLVKATIGLTDNITITLVRRKNSENADEQNNDQTVQKIEISYKNDNRNNSIVSPPALIRPYKNKVAFLFLFAIIITSFSGDPSRSKNDRNVTVAALQKQNLMLRKQMFDKDRKDNKKLASLTKFIFEKIEEKEIASKYFRKELETFYEKEINQLKEEVSFLKADYETLQNNFKAIKSIVNRTEKNEQFHNDADLNFKMFIKLVTLFNQKINVSDIKNMSTFDCYVDCVKGILGSIELPVAEFSISTIFSDYFKTLNYIKNYILEKDIKSRFLEYRNRFIDYLRFQASKKPVTKLYSCLFQVERNNQYEIKVKEIKSNLLSLLKMLGEYDLIFNSEN